MLGTFFDGIARHTKEALQWTEDINQRGPRVVIADHDRPRQTTDNSRSAHLATGQSAPYRQMPPQRARCH